MSAVVELFGYSAEMTLQQAVNSGDYQDYLEFSRLVNQRPVATLRDLLQLRGDLQPIPLEQVEPIEAILPRFDYAGMSLGASSPEAHETPATAMNRLGVRSNSGEGGEDSARYTGGTLLAAGVAGERFAVRNSGAQAVFPLLRQQVLAGQAQGGGTGNLVGYVAEGGLRGAHGNWGWATGCCLLPNLADSY